MVQYRHQQLQSWRIWHNLILSIPFLISVPLFMHALRLVSLNWKHPRVTFYPVYCDWLSVRWVWREGEEGVSRNPFGNNPGLKDVKRNHHNNNSSAAFIIVIHMNAIGAPERSKNEGRKLLCLYLFTPFVVHFQRGWKFLNY